MAIKILEFPKWIVGGILGFVGAIGGSLTGSTVTKPDATPEVPPGATPPIETIPDLIEAIGAMSSTEVLIVLGIGMLAIYGLLTLFRGRGRR